MSFRHFILTFIFLMICSSFNLSFTYITHYSSLMITQKMLDTWIKEKTVIMTMKQFIVSHPLYLNIDNQESQHYCVESRLTMWHPRNCQLTLIPWYMIALIWGTYFLESNLYASLDLMITHAKLYGHNIWIIQFTVITMTICICA
jgi:hypothetical protein